MNARVLSHGRALSRASRPWTPSRLRPRLKLPRRRTPSRLRPRLSMVQDGARGARHWSAGGATGSARVSAGGARCPMVDSPGCARGARHWSAGGATGRARGSPGAAHSLANGGDVGSRAEHPAGRWSLRLSAERATARGAKRFECCPHVWHVLQPITQENHTRVLTTPARKTWRQRRAPSLTRTQVAFEQRSVEAAW